MTHMPLKVKIGAIACGIIATLLFVSLTINAYQPISYRHLSYVNIKHVMDWPPLAVDEINPKPSYTPPSHRGFLQLLSSKGVRAIDDNAYEYFLSGSADIKVGLYSLQADSDASKYRLCSAPTECIDLTERSSLFRPRS